MDCFIATSHLDRLDRRYFLQITKQALSPFAPQIISTGAFERYGEAERKAESEIYILSDDDIIPADPSVIPMGLEIMSKHPEIGLLGFAWNKNLSFSDLGSWAKEKLNDGLVEIDHVGGLRIVRKGLCAEVKPSGAGWLSKADDKAHSEAIKAAGYKVVIWLGGWFHHLGEGYSVIWKKE